jgi:demethylmenaquinone methyltransferase/2-methoxy-6-polyprenyl-1,4-benzoquinol methylase
MIFSMMDESKTLTGGPSEPPFSGDAPPPSPTNPGRRTYSRDHVRSLFESIAYRYDFLNHLLSAGFDIRWRRRAAKLLAPHAPKRILDVATGTGDLAIALSSLKPQEIVGIDIAPTMLEIARQKVAGLSDAAAFRFLEASAEHLPFDDNSFDAATVAFGVRNFSNIGAGLSEIYRVLRPEGVLLILEFSRPRIFPVKQLYGFYFHHILPAVGTIVSGNKEAYRYLPATVDQFPDGAEFARILDSYGFTVRGVYLLTFGIVSIYVSSKHKTIH